MELRPLSVTCTVIIDHFIDGNGMHSDGGIKGVVTLSRDIGVGAGVGVTIVGKLVALMLDGEAVARGVGVERCVAIFLVSRPWKERTLLSCSMDGEEESRQ